MKKLNLSNKNKNLVYLAVLLGCIAAAVYLYHCGFQKVCKSETVEKVVRSRTEMVLPKGKVYAEIVDTPQSRAKGLSGREGLAEDEGMLFVFDHPGKYGFWMKDMLFSIDIVWINKEGVVVHIERHVKPSSYFATNPPQTFVNVPDASYVLELADGQAEKYGLYLGTKVELGE